MKLLLSCYYNCYQLLLAVGSWVWEDAKKIVSAALKANAVGSETKDESNAIKIGLEDY